MISAVQLTAYAMPSHSNAYIHSVTYIQTLHVKSMKVIDFLI